MMDDPVADKGLPWLAGRLRATRIERGMALTELARRAQLSRSYLHALESGGSADGPTPTASVLYRIAQQLGVSIADLVEREPRQLADIDDASIPGGLLEAARELGLTKADVRQLAAIRFRGRQPQSVERWKLLITQLELSEQLDGRPDRKRRDTA